MADFFDDASDLEALYRESSIAKIRNKRATKRMFIS